MAAVRANAKDKCKRNDTPEKVKVTEDFSPEMRQHRKLLIERMITMKDQAKASGNHDFRCVARYDKLIINNVLTSDNKLKPVT